MIENKDLYEILGLTPAASPEQIKTAFRSLAQKYHPDLCKDQGDHDVSMFVAITEAYETLSDPELRNEYNKSRGFEHYEEVKIAGSGFSKSYDPEREELLQSARVDIASERISTAAVYSSVSADENANGFRIGQKVSKELESATENEHDDDLENSELEEVTAWGETPTVDKTSGTKKASIFNIGAKVGSLLSKATAAQIKRQNLKNTLKSRMSEEPDRTHFSSAKKPQNPFFQQKKPDPNNTAQMSVPRGERIFEFRISKLEALVGTTRKLALQGRDGDPIMRDVNIPAGVSSGQIMEVSWGWERAKIKVIVNFEALWDVRGLDIFLRLPVTIDEVIEGMELSVPCFASQTRIKLSSSINITQAVVSEGKGLLRKGRHGNLITTICIVPPANDNPTLFAAASALESAYTSDVRGDLLELIQNPAWFWSDESRDYLQVPITFFEALRGARIRIAIEKESIEIDIPKHCTPEVVLEVPVRDRTLCILPVVVLPARVDASIQAAARAIGQFYNSPVRKNLPKKFSA